MLEVIRCAGHPRDLGLDQGRSCLAAVRARVSASGRASRRSRIASLLPYASGPVRGSGAGRELIRHFSHLSERIDGLARGAGVEVDSILSLHLDPAVCSRTGELGSLAVAIAAGELRGHDGAILARSLPLAAPPGSPWLVRRSRPAVGFGSIELTLPWLVSALAGVNEGGLCAAFVADAEPLSEAPRPGRDRASAPPAFLLVQECLQRFGDLEAGLGWCMSRPAKGRGSVLLADARGAVASVRFDAAGRRVVARPLEGVLVAGGSAAVADLLRKRAADERVLETAALAADDAGRAYVRLSSIDSALRVSSEGDKHEELCLQA